MKLSTKIAAVGVIVAAVWATGRTQEYFAKAAASKALRAAADASWDVIIVGAGSSGAAAAGRISKENRKLKVLVLEAGGRMEDARVRTPILAGTLQAPWAEKFGIRGSFDWGFKTVPQKFSHLGTNDRVSNWPRGKGLGGSSSINYMAWVRGAAADYNSWEDAGAQGWGWENVEPVFRRIENYSSGDGSAGGADSHRGRGGLVNVTELESPRESTMRWIDAMSSLLSARGHKVPDVEEFDYNSVDNLVGVGLTQLSSSSGKRCSSADAYLRPAMAQNRISVVTHAHVSRILFASKVATGVEVIDPVTLQPISIKLSADKAAQIVLSAGAIGSPTILIRSGIGPEETLARIFPQPNQRISALEGVGKNLQDHLCSFIHLSREQEDSLNLGTVFSPANWLKYLTSSSDQGPLASNYIEAVAHLCVGNPTGDCPFPDLQMYFSPSIGTLVDRLNLNLNNTAMKTNVRVDDGAGAIGSFGQGITLLMINLHPESRGSLTITSSDPFEHPIIDPAYLENEKDIDVMAEGIKLGLESAFAPEMQGVLPPPKCLLCPKDVDPETLRDYVRHFSVTLYHPVGTCKMGSEDDKMAVVNPELKVHGVQALRVADSSIMPFITSGNTNAPSIMIGERAADLVLAEFELSEK